MDSITLFYCLQVDKKVDSSLHVAIHENGLMKGEKRNRAQEITHGIQDKKASG